MAVVAPVWSVTYQTETMGVGPAGLPVAGVRVGFKTGTGQEGTIFVPDASYTPDAVRAAIAERVAAMAAVAGLSG